MNLMAHWELKAVALVLAVALFIYTSGQVRVDKTMSVTITEASVRNLPQDYQVVNITPREFKVLLSVPTSRSADIEAETVSPVLELRAESLAAKNVSWLLTSHLLRLPNDVRITGTEPADIREVTVQLDRVIEGSLPVEPPHLVGLPPGLDADIALDVTMAQVSAGGDTLELLHHDRERIRFQDVDLRTVDPKLTGERKERMVLTPLAAPQETPYRITAPISATVTIHPLLGMTRELSAPIQLLAGRDLLRSVDLTLTPPRATLTVRGPENLLKDLTPEALTAFVRLPDDLGPDTSQDLPVEILAPSWLVVQPVRVRVAAIPLKKP